ncbi:uncharacterized protein [Phaseolus vulgaris]|uniref:uncharacterized protein n=1 Tax=Phaseolus vulgaris TaxID=3885 RepID=UPI0035C9EDB9
MVMTQEKRARLAGLSTRGSAANKAGPSAPPTSATMPLAAFMPTTPTAASPRATPTLVSPRVAPASTAPIKVIALATIRVVSPQAPLNEGVVHIASDDEEEPVGGPAFKRRKTTMVATSHSSSARLPTTLQAMVMTQEKRARLTGLLTRGSAANKAGPSAPPTSATMPVAAFMPTTPTAASPRATPTLVSPRVAPASTAPIKVIALATVRVVSPQAPLNEGVVHIASDDEEEPVGGPAFKRRKTTMVATSHSSSARLPTNLQAMVMTQEKRARLTGLLTRGSAANKAGPSAPPTSATMPVAAFMPTTPTAASPRATPTLVSPRVAPASTAPIKVIALATVRVVSPQAPLNEGVVHIASDDEEEPVGGLPSRGGKQRWWPRLTHPLQGFPPTFKAIP